MNQVQEIKVERENIEKEFKKVFANHFLPKLQF